MIVMVVNEDNISGEKIVIGIIIITILKKTIGNFYMFYTNCSIRK